MKHLKHSRKHTLVIMLIVGLTLVFFYWYKQNNSLEATSSLQVNSVVLTGKLLIATDGSPFKDAVVAGILDHYNSTSVVVEVVNVKALANVNVADFDAILIIHRWEAGGPAMVVESFIDKNIDLKNKMVILTTSWNGLEKLENIDAITGASIEEDAPVFTEKSTKRLDRLFNDKN